MGFTEFINGVLRTFCADMPDAEDTVLVQNDRENGRFYAKLPDGVLVIARPGSTKATVRYLRHQWMTELSMA